MNVGVLATSRRRSSPSFLAPHVTDGRGCLVSGLRVNSGIRKVMVVRVFVAGGTGAMGRRLGPPLGARGHQLAATSASPGELGIQGGGAALRYGSLYGPGAIDDWVELVRKRQFPLVGGGTGYMSWVHLDDAASATVLAVEQHAKGVFNIVDDEPAPAREWLPYLAACAGAKRPIRIPKWLARQLAGEMAGSMRTEGAGFS